MPAATLEPAAAPVPNRVTRPARQGSPASVDPAAFHRQHVGKIVFFRRPVERGSEDLSAVASRFGPGEHVYGIAYLAKSFKEMNFVPSRENLRGAFTYEVYVDGEMQHVYGGFKVDLSWEEYQNPNHKHARVHVLPNPKEVAYRSPSEFGLPLTFLTMLGKLPAGRHTVELRLMDPYNPAAVGSFEIDTSGGTEWIASAAEGLKRNQADSVTMPAPAMRNAALEASMVEALKANGWRQQVLRVVIVAPDWRIHRTPSGAIDFRSLNTVVALKEPDGRCRLFEISFKQPHQGGNRFGRTEQYGVGWNRDISCENVR